MSMSTWNGNNILEVLLKTRVEDHVPRRINNVNVDKRGSVMVVSPQDPLPRVLRQLATEGFLSAPVLKGTKRGTSPICSGSVCSVCSVCSGFTDVLLEKADTEEEWVDFWEKSDDFGCTKVADVMKTPDEWQRDPYPPTLEGYSTFHALEHFALAGTHRQAILNNLNQVVGIITQSMIISFLRQKRVDDINFGGKFPSSKVLKINQDEKAINAFNKMVNSSVTGIAVVDDSDTLVDCISVKDLKGVGVDGSNFFRLFRSVRHFKDMVRAEYPRLAPRSHYSRKPVPPTAVYVTPESTLQDVLDKLEDGNVGRVFVCTASSHRMGVPKLCGIVSQKDLLKAVLDYCVNTSISLTPETMRGAPRFTEPFNSPSSQRAAKRMQSSGIGRSIPIA